MLLNLKRAYVRIRGFRMAHDVSDLVVALDPTALVELRDRGLLASHLQEYGAALRDLEAFLRLSGGPGGTNHLRRGDGGRPKRRVKAETPPSRSGQDLGLDDVKEVWDHVKALRRRIASLN
jgi:hypothetical protein